MFPRTNHELRIKNHESRGSQLAARGSRLAAHGSRLTAHGSRLTAHGSRLAITPRPLARPPDNLLRGHPDPNSVSDEAIVKACKLSTLPEQHFTRLDYPVGKQGRNIRVVDRASMMIARAMLADVDIIVINRTEAVFNHGK